ncbi:MAG: hypothetical protein JJ863_21485 [Deltaproteobacteria bacterium]|nr:hypothetical protein [Deltaproteobacteria bacterium]
MKYVRVSDRFDVPDSALRSARKLIGAGRDLLNEDLRAAIADRLEEAMDDASVPVSEWVDKNGRDLITVELRLERTPAVAILVEHNSGDGRLVCLGFMSRNLARRIVARREWRSRAA